MIKFKSFPAAKVVIIFELCNKKVHFFRDMQENARENKKERQKGIKKRHIVIDLPLNQRMPC